MLFSCEKNKDQGLNPVYGPAVTMQIGSESALVQELSFNSGNFSIVGDLRAPVQGDLFPAIIMVHGSGGATRYGSVDFESLIEILREHGFSERKIAERANFFNAFSGVKVIPTLATSDSV